MYRDQEQRNFARSLRNYATNAESHLWKFLRAQQLDGHKFRRQAAIGPYIVDFVCLSQKLVIELDGPQHVDPVASARDSERTDWLSTCGYGVLRFRNQELDENIQAVLATITEALNEADSTQVRITHPCLPRRGEETKPELFGCRINRWRKRVVYRATQTWAAVIHSCQKRGIDGHVAVRACRAAA